MKISPIKPFAIKPIIKNSSAPLAFKANIIEGDCFSPSVENKYVKIKTLEGKEFYGIITKEKPKFKHNHNPAEFVMHYDDQNLGYAQALEYNDCDGLFLTDLYTQKNSIRKYKGCGTELLKCIAQESFKRGKNGKVLCCAYNPDESPLMFYFKNNFKACENKDTLIIKHSLFNAPLQYIAKNKSDMYEILPLYFDLSYMELDEKGADALLKDKKLYKERVCDEIGHKNIKGQNYSIQYIEFPEDKKYYIQFLNEDSKDNKLSFIAELKPHKKLSGKNSFEIIKKDNSFIYYCPEINDFAKSILDDLAKQYL